MPATPASLWPSDREKAEAADALDHAPRQARQRAAIDRAHRGAHARRGAQTTGGGRSEDQATEALSMATLARELPYGRAVASPAPFAQTVERSEERRVRKECRSRWSPYH